MGVAWFLGCGLAGLISGLALLTKEGKRIALGFWPVGPVVLGVLSLISALLSLLLFGLFSFMQLKWVAAPLVGLACFSAIMSNTLLYAVFGPIMWPEEFRKLHQRQEKDERPS